MGLEIVELIMGVEERFAIEIADTNAELFVTVGDVYDYLCHTLGGETQRVCENQRTFHRIRKTLMRTMQLPRGAVRPARPLDDLLPAGFVKRNLALRRLRNEIGVQMNANPGDIVTVGTVVRLAVAQHEHKRRYTSQIPIEGWTATTIWQALREIVVNQLEVEPERVVRSARFIDDLGCG